MTDHIDPPPAGAAAGSASSPVIAGRQSNHGSYRLPGSVAHLGHLPFYLVVAHWACLLGREVGRDEISQAFHVTVNRAADVMSYIVTTRQDVITCATRKVDAERGQRCRLLKVTAVSDTPRSRSPEVRTMRAHPEPPEASVANLRHWFLTRPNPSNPG
ncbi:CaiF/GrlA family transcriptional regulator [Serratia quinivorans]|uniref:CaiF/GrlA family transcriptional regulator n=1 Tax=Serratia quinivorans TaxID=137545 RepID=UPI0039B06CC5